MEATCPYTIRHELSGNAFPAGIPSEIRAVFARLSRYYLSGDISAKGKNASKAGGHIKRSIPDCHKYACMAYDGKRAEFSRNYKNVGLPLVDSGGFLPKLPKARNEAIALMLDARKSDLAITSGDEANADDEAREKYERAFVKRPPANELIESSGHKTGASSKKEAVFRTGTGWMVGIVGIILAIVF
jgi:hypothetical protein